MIRTAVAGSFMLLAFAACASNADGESCQIVGTYAVTDSKESGTCPAPSATPDTYTISASEGGFVVEVQGVNGSCTATSVSSCKIQGKCDVGVREPLDPTKARGTMQFSWTFDGKGFTGSSTYDLPPAKPLPDGCEGVYRQDGARR